MTEQIVGEINTPQDTYGGIEHALNYAVGALIAHKTAKGDKAFAGIDVEQLFTAVQVLADRDSAEVAPFVSWSPVLDSIGSRRRISGFFDKDFRESIVGNGLGFNTPSKMITDVVHSVVGSRDSQATFSNLEARMLSSLGQLVEVDAGRVGYLSPLLTLDDDLIEIATLNYDRSIELLAEREGIACDTGIAAWTGGHDWAWSQTAKLRLLKLHGSIDWRVVSKMGDGGLRESSVIVGGATTGSGRGPILPGIVFGARGKLMADGPFLAMLRAFDEMLAGADHLVVVGYSFRDEHVNVAIRRWINSGPIRKLTVVDPKFDQDPRERSQHSFTKELVRAINTFNPESGTRDRLLDLRIIRKYAVEGLSEALFAGEVGEAHAGFESAT
jgi:hypothetical protein